jgi:polar amino acid transport system substrate-binding protein
MAGVGTFPPDIYIDDSGKSTGWELDLVNAALQLLGLKADLKATTFAGIVPGLQNGKFDLAPDTVSLTADRIKIVDIVTVAKVGTSFAVKAGSGTTINSVTDLCGHTVATLSGSLFITQLQGVSKQCQAAGKPQLTVQTYQDIPTVVLAVTNGRAQTLALGTTRLVYYKSRANGGLSSSSLVYLPAATGIALAKDSPLSKPLVSAINELIANGQYKSILAKYGVSDIAVPAANIDK